MLPLGIASAWTAERVTDTDGYVEAVGPLASDPAVQRELASRIETRARVAIGVGRMERADARAARQKIHVLVAQLVQAEEFRTVWDEANRIAHGQLITVLDSRGSGAVPLDLTPVLDGVLVTLGAQGLPVRTADVAVVVYVADAGDLEKARAGYRVVHAAGYWVPALCVALIVCALVVARRRGQVLGILGAGAAVTCGLTLLVLGAVRSTALDSVPSADRGLAGAVWDVLVHSLRTMLVVAVVVGVVLVVVSIAVRVLRPPEKAPAGDFSLLEPRD